MPIMSDSRLTRLAWIVTRLGMALLFLALGLIVLRAPAGLLPDITPWYSDFLVTAAVAYAIIVGGFVAARLPRNPTAGCCCYSASATARCRASPKKTTPSVAP